MTVCAPGKSMLRPLTTSPKVTSRVLVWRARQRAHAAVGMEAMVVESGREEMSIVREMAWWRVFVTGRDAGRREVIEEPERRLCQ